MMKSKQYIHGEPVEPWANIAYQRILDRPSTGSG